MITAILRAQWLSMRSFQLDSHRRAAIFSVITAVVWYAFWSFLAYAAEAFIASAESVEALARPLPVALMFVFLYWQLAPLVSASLGASLDLKKLLVYPIPPKKLFVVEVLLRITTCAEMIVFLAGVVIGLMRNPSLGGLHTAPLLMGLFGGFILFNLLLAAGTRSLIEQALTNKRLREVSMMLVVLCAAIPQVLMYAGATAGPIKQWMAATSSPFWPWSATATTALGGDPAIGLAILAIWTGLAWRFSSWQFERSLRFDAAASAPRTEHPERKRSRAEAFYRLPSLFLPDPMAAIVEKELRVLSRTARFRMVFIMGFTFGLLVWLPLLLGRNSRKSMVVSEHFLTLVSVYALTLLGQVSYLNSFGFDRSAVQVYYSVPVRFGKALMGKNLAAAIFISLEALLVSIACLLLKLPVTWSGAAEAFVVTGIVGLYLVGLGNLSSVHFPRPMNPERVSQGGSGSRMQALIFLLFPVALLPVFLAFWAQYIFHSTIIFYALLGLAGAVGLTFYWIAMGSAESVALKRREVILTELSRGEGPVVTG